jgi:hypothetical protein
MRCHYDVVLDVMDEDDDAVCVAQQMAGAGYLALTVTTDAGVVPTSTFGGRKVAHQVSLTSAGNLSAKNFTIAGYDADGAAITETRVGPNANTVETTKYFAKVVSVYVDAAVATDVKVGFVDEARTQCLTTDAEATKTSFNVDLTGTANYTIQYTLDKTTAAPTNALRYHSATDSALVGASASQTGSMTIPVLGFRIQTNSYSSGAEVRITLLQAP